MRGHSTCDMLVGIKSRTLGWADSTAARQAAFRGQAMRNHPDRFPGEAEKAAASTRFQQLNEAYSVLRDPARRQQYDLSN